jgi:AcrR family transcriptional regulator
MTRWSKSRNIALTMSSTTVTPAPRPRGRPRSSRAHDAIIDAVLELLTEGTTVEALSIEAVAAKAGVGKATIYRRWPHKDALLLDAVESVKDPVPEPTGVSVRDDLILLTRAMGTARDTRAGKLFPCLMPELQRDGGLRDAYLAMVERRRDVTRGVLRRGIADGTLRPDTDVELAVALLSGPMLSSLLGSLPRLDTTDLADRVVDTVLRGIAAKR